MGPRKSTDKAAKRQLHVMRTSVLPDLMAECAIDRMVGRDGWEVKVEDFVSGSLPSAQSP